MDPFTALAAASAVVKGISTVLDHEAQDDQYDANKRAAERALRLKRRDLTIREIEEQVAAGQILEEGRRESAAAIGTATASTASAGVRGASADAITLSILGDQARHSQSVRDNLVRTQDQIDRLRAGADAQAQSRINSVQRPSMLQTALRLGGIGLGAYTTQKRYTDTGGG